MAKEKKFKLKKSTFFSDFKAFIAKGNVVDLAVAVIIGAAFSAIVNSLVNDIIMPLLTWAMGGNGIAGATLVLNGVEQFLADGTVNPAAVLWNYGNFIQAILNFVIIALCIFTALRIVTKAGNMTKSFADKEKKMIMKQFKKGEISEEEAKAQAAEADAKAEPAPAAPVETTDDLLREIRDLLKAAKDAQSVVDAQAKLEELDK